MIREASSIGRCIEWRHVGLWIVVGLATTSATPAAPRTPGDPTSYEMFGQRYHVLRSAEGYVERGVASWYGGTFHGNPTASGEIFDMHALTAAHKTLPLPTHVEVTSQRTGKSVVVRVNDRGPFLDDRIIDLSYAAARALDLVDAGIELVEIRALGLEALAADAGGAEPRKDAPP